MRKKTWATVGVAVLALIGLACGAAEPPEDKPTAEPVATMTKPAPPVGKAKPVTIDEGQWEVGTDVKPGKYKTKGAKPSEIMFCSWTVTKGKQFVDMGSNNSDTAQGVVTIKAGQTFETSGCQPWTLQSAAKR